MTRAVVSARPVSVPATPGRVRRYPQLWVAVLFLTPALVIVLGIRVWPLVESIRLSFTDWDGISDPNDVGWANYARLLRDDRFHHALLNTGKLLLAVPILVGLPFVIAAALQSRLPGWRFYRSAFFFPTLISPAVIALVFKMLLREDGPINEGLRMVGLDSWTRVWLTDPDWAMIWVVAVAAWALIGVGTVIFLAAMGSVDPNLIDAARIDGAGWLRIQRSVVFWQILPVIELWTVLTLIGLLTQFFPLILLLTNGGPNFATTTADLFAYNAAFVDYESGYSSAATMVIFVVTIVVVGLVMGAFKSRRSE